MRDARETDARGEEAAPVSVLFSMSDTGAGHRSAAVAIRAALEQASDLPLSCQIIDTLKTTNVPVLRNSPTLYDQLSTRWLSVYDAGYRLTNNRRLVGTVSRLVYMRAWRNIVNTLDEVQPELVVVTHPLTQRFVGLARRVHRLSFRLVTVVTDLVSLHASWTYPDVDLCVVTTDEAYRMMQRRGMPDDLLVQTGFPVHPKFVTYARSQDEARRDLGLHSSLPTILVTGGGVGSGRVQELVPLLEETCPESQLLIVTGKNRTLYDELHSQPRSPHTHVYGFVNNMEALMAASDMVVTKAGPGTLMEALVMRRPVLITSAVGMQEEGNIDFVLNRELGFFCPSHTHLIDAIQQLMQQQVYAATVERLADAVPRTGAQQIADLLLDQLQQSGHPPARRRRLVLRRSWNRVRRRRAPVAQKRETQEPEEGRLRAS